MAAIEAAQPAPALLPTLVNTEGGEPEIFEDAADIEAEDEKPTDDTQGSIEVTLEGQEHPYNWPLRRRWCLAMLASSLIFAATISSSGPSGAAAQFQRQFGFGQLSTTLLVSAYLLGYTTGPFLTGPSTETFGRRWPSVTFMALLTIFNGATAGCSSLPAFLVCRFLAGASASAPMTSSGSIVSDLFPPHERGIVIAVWSIGSFSGPALGPLIGGNVSAAGLPCFWIFVNLTALTGLLTLATFFFLPETYEPKLLRLKAAQLRRETGDARYSSKYDVVKLDVLHTIRTMVTRPPMMFLQEPILVLSTLYSSFSYSVLYMLFPFYPHIFHELHHLPPGKGDLPFLGILGGVFLGIPTTILYQKKYRRDLEKNGGKHMPEMRLPLSYFGGPIMFTGLLWLGWSGYKADVSPVLPALSGIPIGLASVLVFRSFTQYVVESYRLYSSSAMVALVVFRSMMGAGLPLCVPAMVRALGVQWSATLLAGFQLLLLPIPFLFSRYGPKIRQKGPYSKDS